jgi:tetratricopeptide (TPR) repeat protein
MGISRKTSADLVRNIRAIAAQEEHNPRALFTILAGAGVTLSAGMPSTTTLVSAMKARKATTAAGKSPEPWGELLSAAEKEGLSANGTGAYQELFNDPEIFPSPLHRQRFISQAITWASSRGPGFSPESLRLASILLAGAGRRVEADTPAQKEPNLGGWLAHTLYTTNFDEVIPQTLHYCGEPVIVVDHPGAHGRLHGEAHYPRVAYLHGCHLHYSLRNTPSELVRPDSDRTGGVDLPGLFLRFRDVLRSTGLIVLGYSGWDDRAILAIRDALADEESLPYGIYWGARSGDTSLSHTAQQLLHQHTDRAFMLDEGKEAAHTLQVISEGLGIPYRLDMDRWQPRILALGEKFGKMRPDVTVESPVSPKSATVAPSPVVIRATNELQLDFEQSQLVAEGARILNSFEGTAARAWLNRATEAIKSVRGGGAQPSAELLAFLGNVQLFLGDAVHAVENITSAFARFEADGRNEWAASALVTKADALIALEHYADAESAASEAANRYKKLEDWNGYLSAVTTLTKVGLRRDRLSIPDAYLAQALKVAESTRPDTRSDFYQALADSLMRRGKDQEAKKYGSLSLAAAVNPVTKSNALLTVARLALKRDDTAEASQHFEEARALSRDIHEPVNEAASEIGLGEVASRNNQFERACVHFQRADELAQGISGFAANKARLKVLRAEVLAASGAPGDHEAAARQAIAELDRIGSTVLTYEARLAKARMDARAGKRAEALAVLSALGEKAAEAGEVMLHRIVLATLAKIKE